MTSNFQRTIRAAVFCTVLLSVAGTYFLNFSAFAEKQDPIAVLLKLPAPPPPNPLVKGVRGERGDKFYSKSTPPDENAPIDELLDYWQHQSISQQPLRYSPEPSQRSLDRLMKEIDKDHGRLPSFLNLLKKAPEFVKNIYDSEGVGGAFDRDTRRSIKRWLTYNSPYFSSDLERLASRVSDSNEYVTNQEELLALSRVDFDRAKPIIDRLYSDPSLKTSRVLARWALYRHALETGSTSDIDRYRDELKEIVEDKSALPGMRDLALDALSGEKDWSGRDDWYYKLLEDETLGELNVNGQTYTGLTTLVLVSPQEKYLAKMIELAGSSNKAVRSAAIRNLITRLDGGGPEVIRALLPWLEDPKWATDAGDARGALVRALSEYEIPESVPGLIKMLDEPGSVPDYRAIATNAANAAVAAAMNAVANAASQVSNSVNANRVRASGPAMTEGFPHRSAAIHALAKQKDSRAAPALRRILPDVTYYERSGVVRALLLSGGFSIGEQLAALENVARRGQFDEGANMAEHYAAAANRAVWAVNAQVSGQKTPLTAADIRDLLAEQLTQSEEISDGLARALVDRIEELDKSDQRMAAALRAMILKWQNAAVNMLLLRDVKRGIANADTIVRLLSQRKALKEHQPSDVFDLRTGTSSAVGVAACLIDDAPDYLAILDNGDVPTKTAMLACARLVRAQLPVAKVAENLKNKNEALQLAAERYLESEDSAEARAIVLQRHPGEARILGATSAFYSEADKAEPNEYLWMLFRSLGDNSLYYGWGGTESDDDLAAIEKDLREEVKKDGDLLGVYAYDNNYVRIYKERVVYSWDEDESRYRERPITKLEFDELKDYLTANNADSLPPFLACGGPYCSAKELVMVNRNGGRRVYVAGDYEVFGTESTIDFFAGLDKYFERLRKSPAKLKYALSREIPGLGIVVASDDLAAVTVWKDRTDLRIAAAETSVRQKVRKEIEDPDSDDEGSPDEGEDPARFYAEAQAALERRRYEGYSWYRIVDGEVAGVAAQPAGVEFIPFRDTLSVQPGDQQWKARTGVFELRASDEGLYRVAGGRAVKLRDGAFARPVMTPDGRWAIVSKVSEHGDRIIRVDLVTKREYPVELERYASHLPGAFVPSLNKVLVLQNYYDDNHDQSDEEDLTPSDPGPEGMMLVDAATGAIQPIAGEFRPLAQQTFRPLQNTARPNEFWAAIYDSEKNMTEVGIYETRTFGFRSVLRIPKIRFNSMNMWVDEPGGKVYFVYRGHLLSLPLKSEK